MWELHNNPIWQELRQWVKDTDYQKLQLCENPDVCSKVNNHIASRKDLFDYVERTAMMEFTDEIIE